MLLADKAPLYPSHEDPAKAYDELVLHDEVGVVDPARTKSTIEFSH
jgi:hypothetical protein